LIFFSFARFRDLIGLSLLLPFFLPPLKSVSRDRGATRRGAVESCALGNKLVLVAHSRSAKLFGTIIS
jgi:hypothetical protein